MKILTKIKNRLKKNERVRRDYERLVELEIEYRYRFYVLNKINQQRPSWAGMIPTLGGCFVKKGIFVFIGVDRRGFEAKEMCIVREYPVRHYIPTSNKAMIGKARYLVGAIEVREKSGASYLQCFFYHESLTMLEAEKIFKGL